MEPLLFLTYFTLILLLGLICAIISKRVRTPNILLLLVVGISLSKITYNGQPLIQFPPLFLTSIALFSLIMLSFDISARLKFKEFDALYYRAMKLTFFWLMLNIIILTFLASFLTGMNPFIALAFAILMSSTDPEAILSMFHKSRNTVTETLKMESLLNTPLAILLPFIFVSMMMSSSANFFSAITSNLIPLIQQLATGIGIGILMGFLIFKLFRKYYSNLLSPVTAIIAALLSFIISEQLGGNGIISVMALGFFFGNVHLKDKPHLMEFSSVFADSLEILVFILLGLMISFPLDANFITNSLVLFAVYLILRFIAISITLRQHSYTSKEKLFMALSSHKGIAAASVVLALAAFSIQGMAPFLQLALAFMLYSLMLSTIISFSQRNVIESKKSV